MGATLDSLALLPPGACPPCAGGQTHVPGSPCARPWAGTCVHTANGPGLRSRGRRYCPPVRAVQVPRLAYPANKTAQSGHEVSRHDGYQVRHEGEVTGPRPAPPATPAATPPSPAPAARPVVWDRHAGPAPSRGRPARARGGPARLAHVASRRIGDVDDRLAARVGEVSGQVGCVDQQIRWGVAAACERYDDVRSRRLLDVQPEVVRTGDVERQLVVVGGATPDEQTRAGGREERPVRTAGGGGLPPCGARRRIRRTAQTGEQCRVLPVGRLTGSSQLLETSGAPCSLA